MPFILVGSISGRSTEDIISTIQKTPNKNHTKISVKDLIKNISKEAKKKSQLHKKSKNKNCIMLIQFF